MHDNQMLSAKPQARDELKIPSRLLCFDTESPVTRRVNLTQQDKEYGKILFCVIKNKKDVSPSAHLRQLKLKGNALEWFRLHIEQGRIHRLIFMMQRLEKQQPSVGAV